MHADPVVRPSLEDYVMTSATKNRGSVLRAGEGAIRGPGRGRRPGARAAGHGFRSRCTAGRATTSAASRTPARRSAAAWRSPGNYPGKARTPDELRADLDQALALIPGTHRLNLHASYAETGGKKVERDALEPAHFQGWIDWAKAQGDGDGFQPHLLRPPQGGRRLDAGPPRRGDPQVLDRPRHRLPEDRRRVRQGARARRA